MTSKKGSSLPSTVAAKSPATYQPAGAPQIPASSGAWFGSRTHLVKKDTEFVNAYTDFTEARMRQLKAVNGLMQTRIVTELTAVELGNVDALAEHNFTRGQHERNHEERTWLHNGQLAAINRDTEILQAQLANQQAKAALGDLKKVQPGEPLANSISFDQLEELTASMPEFSEDARSAFVRMARGMLAEKKAGEDAT